MNDRSSRSSGLGRRTFIRTGAGGLGALATLGPTAATPAETLQPWWDARPSSARANRPLAIDLHAHWVPPPYAKAMADLKRPLGNPYPLELDLDQRRKWMDEHGVQMHVLTLNGGMPWQLVTPEEGVRLAQIVNDAGVEAHTAFPDRYIASIELPIRDAGLSLKELNRVAGKPGLRAVHLPDSIDNRDYLDAETALLDAQNRFAQAISALEIATLQYLRDTDQLRVDEHGRLLMPAK